MVKGFDGEEYIKPTAADYRERIERKKRDYKLKYQIGKHAGEMKRKARKKERKTVKDYLKNGKYDDVLDLEDILEKFY